MNAYSINHHTRTLRVPMCLTFPLHSIVGLTWTRFDRSKHNAFIEHFGMSMAMWKALKRREKLSPPEKLAALPVHNEIAKWICGFISWCVRIYRVLVLSTGYWKQRNRVHVCVSIVTLNETLDCQNYMVQVSRARMLKTKNSLHFAITWDRFCFCVCIWISVEISNWMIEFIFMSNFIYMRMIPFFFLI